MVTSVGAGMAVLCKREEIAHDTMAFYFDKPAGFDFRAGQAIDLTLIEPPETDGEGNTRTFSIASAACDAQLMVATRMRDTAFKRVLKTVALGTAVKLDGPSGSFTLHKNQAKDGVFLGGGIGIAPFLSIIRQAASDKLAQQLYLFYSNRRPEDAPFVDALQDCARQNPNFHFVPTMTNLEASKQAWTGEMGKITVGMVSKHVRTLKGPIYYVAGPPGMVTAMRQMLAGGGVDEDDIRTEEFAGY